MNRRTKHMVLTIATWLVIHLQLFAQASATSQVAPRDPEALKLLTAAFNRAGGTEVWKSVHGTRVTGTLTTEAIGPSGRKTVTNIIVWVDDWSTGHHRYSRTAKSASGGSRILRHGDKDTFAAHVGDKAFTVTFDSTSILLTHLPSVSLARILNDDSYSISAHPNIRDLDHDEVLVARRTNGTEQLWYLSKQTGQVDAVRYTVPDASDAFHHPSEIAIYKHYRSESGRSIPDEVDVIRPNSPVTKFRFESLEVNPSVAANEFTTGDTQ